MDYKTINQSMKEQLQGVRWKFTAILFIFIVANTLVQQYINLNTSQTTFTVILNLVISLVLAIIQNTILFIFIKRVRKEKFGIADVKYSCSKILLHVSTGFLLALAQSVFQSVAIMLISYVPILADPILILVQTLFLALTVFVAFGIYDSKGSGNGHLVGNIGGSAKMLCRNIKMIMMVLLPYILWLLICQLGMNLLLNPHINETTKTLAEAISNAIANNPNFMTMYVGINIARVIGSSILCVSLYTSLANIYEFNFTNCYPTMTRRLK